MLRDAAIAPPTRRRLQLGPSMNDYPKLPPRLTRIFANNLSVAQRGELWTKVELRSREPMSAQD